MSNTSRLALAGAAVLIGLGIFCPLCGDGVAAVGATALEQRADTATVRFAVSGMTCGSCATTARLALTRLPGVYGAVVSYDSASAVVRYDPRRLTPQQIAAHLERLTGYRATLPSDSVAPRPR